MERKRIAGVEQDDIIKQSPGAEIPKKPRCNYKLRCVTNPGTSASAAVARAMQQYHTRTSPYTARTPLEARNKIFRQGELKASSQLT